jgi:hypothetical protein
LSSLSQCRTLLRRKCEILQRRHYTFLASVGMDQHQTVSPLTECARAIKVPCGDKHRADGGDGSEHHAPVLPHEVHNRGHELVAEHHGGARCRPHREVEEPPRLGILQTVIWRESSFAKSKNTPFSFTVVCEGFRNRRISNAADPTERDVGS